MTAQHRVATTHTFLDLLYGPRKSFLIVSWPRQYSIKNFLYLIFRHDSNIQYNTSHTHKTRPTRPQAVHNTGAPAHQSRLTFSIQVIISQSAVGCASQPA